MFIIAHQDLINEFSVSIGSDYNLNLKFSGNPNFTGNRFISDIRDNDDTFILRFDVQVVNHDTISLNIKNNAYPQDMKSSTYQYDVLMINNDTNEKIYILEGKIQFVKRISR